MQETQTPPPDALTKLSEDGDLYVRYNVATNPNTPIDVLAKLSEDKYGFITTAAKTALEERGEAALEDTTQVKSRVRKNR